MNSNKFLVIATAIAIAIYFISTTIATDASTCESSCIKTYNEAKEKCKVDALKAGNDTCMKDATSSYELCIANCSRSGK